jgi:hypothetical protein
LNGLESSSEYFVRSRYINIITTAVYLLSPFINEMNLVRQIPNILKYYKEILKRNKIPEEEEEPEEDLNSSSANN